MKAYELEVHFIGEPEYFYYDNKREAEKTLEYISKQPAEAAAWGLVKTTATINVIELAPNQYIEGNEIITTYRTSLGGKIA